MRHVDTGQVQLRALGQGAGCAGRVGVVLAEQAGGEELLGRFQFAQFAAQPVEVLAAGLRVEVDHQQRALALLHPLPEAVVAGTGIHQIGQRRVAAQGAELAAEEFGEGAFAKVRPGEQHAGIRGCAHGDSR
ncbi:hypothetical protein D3C85_1564680 [compost metagenome]